MDDIRSPLLLQFLHRNPMDFWRVCLDNGFFPTLSDFSLKLLPTVASEATVERKLWRQRVISPPDRSSNSEITELNRVLPNDYLRLVEQNSNL